MGSNLRPNLVARAITEATLDHASEFHLLCDPRGEPIWVAPAVMSVLGYQVEEFLAMPAWAVVHPDDVERVRRVHAELALDEGGRRRVQYRCRHADDSWRWVEAVSTNLLNRPGVEGIVTTMRDVTSRVMAKRRLSQSERQLRSIVSSAGDIIAILDEKGEIDYVTPTVAALLQRSSREMAEDWGRYVHPDDLESLSDLFKQALEDPGVTQGPVDMRLEAGDGTWVTLEALFTDYRTDPIVRGIVLNARDVSERRRIEASERNNQRIFNTLVEMAPVGIFLTDARGEWTYVNNRIAADFDVNSTSMLNSGWKDLFDAADVVRFRSELARWDGTGRFVTELKTRTSPDARELRLTLSRPGAGGDDLGMVGTLEDVTDRRGLDEMLVEGAALGSVAGVVGSAAHDLHNLLASIGFQLGLLALPAGDADRVSAANEAIDRACDITEDLMAIARPSRNKVGPVEIGSLVAGLTDMLRVLVEHQADVTFVDNSAGRLAATDRSGLERVITNLVVNARDAVEPRGKIAVRVDTTEREGLPFLAISVTDNGCGIPEAFLARMFEPYFTTKEDGNGIGLAASRRTVREWGGDIGVETEEGRGTTMTVYLPVTTG
ncbi:MAG: PAS domain S-box protein [Actinomycetota bacterium]